MMIFTKPQTTRWRTDLRLPQLLRTQGAGTYNKKASSTVEPCFAYASYPIAFRLADEISSESTYAGMAVTLLRHVYRAIAAGCQKDTEDESEVGPLKEQAPARVEDVEEEAEACATMAMAMARPVNVQDHDPLPERPVVRQVTEVAKSVADPARKEGHADSDAADSSSNQSDTDSDTDSDDGSDDEDSSSASSSSHSTTSSFFTRPTLRRSPLSRSKDGLCPVYAGYRCTIQGCNFAASTQQHVRHHMLTASHWYLLEVEEE